MTNFQQKINSFFSNLDFTTRNHCDLEYDTANNFARPIWILGNMYTPDYANFGSSLEKNKHFNSNASSENFSEALSETLSDLFTFDTSSSTATAIAGRNTASFISKQNSLDFFKNASGNTFLNDFYSKFWFTYRKNFTPIKYLKYDSDLHKFQTETSNLTSDIGWGCVIRCTQMLLAQALVIKLLGRSWRKIYTGQTTEDPTRGFNAVNLTPADKRNHMIYNNILSWFLDFPGNAFSIHTLCELLVEELKCDNWQPGNWLGPATAANIVQQSVELAKCSILSMELNDLKVYIARDSLIDEEEIYGSPTDDLRSPSSNQPPAHATKPEDSVIILVPLRLGTSEFNLEYKNCLLKLFCFDNFLGIIGGQPRKSYYFIGAQGDELIYLDPHYTQESITSTNQIKSDNIFNPTIHNHSAFVNKNLFCVKNESTFHCKVPSRLFQK